MNMFGKNMYIINKINKALENFKQTHLILDELGLLFTEINKEQQHALSTVFYAIKFNDYPDYFFPKGFRNTFQSSELYFHFDYPNSKFSLGTISVEFKKKEGNVKVLPSVLSLMQPAKTLAVSEKALMCAKNSKELYQHLIALSTKQFTQHSVNYFIEKISPDQDLTTVLLPSFHPNAIEAILDLSEKPLTLLDFNTLELHLSPLENKAYKEQDRLYTLGQFGSLMQDLKKCTLSNEYLHSYYEKKQLETITTTSDETSSIKNKNKI